MQVIIFVKADMCLFNSVSLCFHVVLHWTTNICMFNGYCNACEIMWLSPNSLLYNFFFSSYSILSFGAPAANKYKVIVDGRDPMLFETSQVCALFFHFLLAVSITLQSPLKPTRFAEPIQNQW